MSDSDYTQSRLKDFYSSALQCPYIQNVVVECPFLRQHVTMCPWLAAQQEAVSGGDRSDLPPITTQMAPGNLLVPDSTLAHQDYRRHQEYRSDPE